MRASGASVRPRTGSFFLKTVMEDSFLIKAIRSATGPLDDYCLGYNLRGGYFLAFHVAATAGAAESATAGSPHLEAICAFDQAEVDGAYLGQLNIMNVSSFCGPHGLIWGYHLVEPADLREQALFSLPSGGGEIKVYSAEPLLRASQALFGTREKKRFPILPGSHTPAATTIHTQAGPGVIGAAFGIGIVADQRGAHILMEDASKLADQSGADVLARRVAEGVVAVSRAQRLTLREIFVGVRAALIPANRHGCAVALLPYFRLARRALPGGRPANLVGMSLEQWEAAVF